MKVQEECWQNGTDTVISIVIFLMRQLHLVLKLSTAYLYILYLGLTHIKENKGNAEITLAIWSTQC